MSGVTYYVTLPGMKKEPITIPNDATVADFCREVFHRTGVTIFNGFGFVGQGGATYYVPKAGVITNAKIEKQNSVRATGTVTIVAGTGANAFTVTIGGTAYTYTAAAGGETPTAIAAKLVTEINASDTVMANNAEGVITITAITAGAAGNDITLVAGVTGGTGSPTATASGAKLAGGRDYGIATAGPTAAFENAVVNGTETLMSTLASHGDELIIFNVPLGE